MNLKIEDLEKEMGHKKGTEAGGDMNSSQHSLSSQIQSNLRDALSGQNGDKQTDSQIGNSMLNKNDSLKSSNSPKGKSPKGTRDDPPKEYEKML